MNEAKFIFDNFYWIQDIRYPVLTSFFKIFVFLASEGFYVSIVALLAWVGKRKLAEKLAFWVVCSTIISWGLKALFHLPRPPRPYLIEIEQSFGFPSSDVLVFSVFWFIIAYHLKSKIFNALFIIGICFIAFSRIYLGVHYFHDVLGGAILGCLFGFVATRWITHRQEIIFGITFFFFGFLVPERAEVYAAQGILLGLLILKFFEKSEKLEEKISWRPFVFILGIIGLLFIKVSLKNLLPEGMLYTFFRYALLSVFILKGAEFFMIKIESIFKKRF